MSWATYRYFLEPLNGDAHISRMLLRRYLSFISKVELSKKSPLKTLLGIARSDVRSVTGSNLRRIMLLSGKNSMDELKNVDIPYNVVPADEAWRVGFVKELLATRHGDLEVPGLLKTEMDEIMDYLCTQ